MDEETKEKEKNSRPKIFKFKFPLMLLFLDMEKYVQIPPQKESLLTKRKHNIKSRLPQLFSAKNPLQIKYNLLFIHETT
jgi:hypothetical protein